MSIKITSLKLENLKRVKALYLTPTPEGLTVIGGRNGQGKTSVLDGILWACGGGKYAPTSPQRDGALSPPAIDLELSNGIRIKRSGKNSALTVTDPSGNKAGQALLDSFISQFAINLPKFLQGTSKEKAEALLQTLGIGPKIKELEDQEKKLYDSRTAIGRIADAKEKHASELQEYPDVPDVPISVSDLIKTQQNILAKNGENQRKRTALDSLLNQKLQTEESMQRLQDQLNGLVAKHGAICADIETAKKTVEQLQDESTEELERNLANIEAVNAQVACNAAKAHACDEAAELRGQYNSLTAEIEAVRQEKMDLLHNANLPLIGLTIEGGEILYQGKRWDCMSGSEQLRVSVAICQAIQPECGFVLVDKLEQLDPDTQSEFGKWLAEKGIQVIATRVSSDPDDCTLIIEDGLPLGETYIDQVTKAEAENTTTEEEYF